MKKDFFHVLLERSRLGGHGDRKGRHVKWEDAPTKQSMKRSHKDTKSLNENLKPLKRYLEKQVGRAWNAVYSDIRENLSPDSAVQKHVIDHIKDFVELNP